MSAREPLVAAIAASYITVVEARRGLLAEGDTRAAVASDDADARFLETLDVAEVKGLGMR